MNKYAILRFEKLATMRQVGKAGGHNHRSKPVENANPELTKFNEYDPDRTLLVDKVRKLLPKTIRKNGVRAVEVLMTFSPEWFEKNKSLPMEEQKKALEDWKNESIGWLEQTVGKNNVVDWALHLDEKTPHLHCVFVPIDPKGKLNCRHFLGDGKKLELLQDSYFEKMERFGLERGIKKSLAKHTDIAKYYTHINKTEEALRTHLNKIDEVLNKWEKPTVWQAATGLDQWFEEQIKAPMMKIRQLFKSVYTQKKHIEQKEQSLKIQVKSLTKSNSSLANRFSQLEEQINKFWKRFGVEDWKEMPDAKFKAIKQGIGEGLKKWEQGEAHKKTIEAQETLSPLLPAQKVPEALREAPKQGEQPQTTPRTVLKPRF